MYCMFGGHTYGGFPFYHHSIGMTTTSILIESLCIEGKTLAIERHSNNCWVNLTSIAKQFGKLIGDWLRLKETKEYLDMARRQLVRYADMHIGQDGSPLIQEPIIVRDGGRPDEQGTWATDYRVAMRFLQWVSPEFAWAVDDLLVRVLRGEHLTNNDGLLEIGGKQFVSGAMYCKAFGKSMHSFYGLISNYRMAFLYWEGSWYMSLALFQMREAQAKLENRKQEIRSVDVGKQLAIEFSVE